MFYCYDFLMELLLKWSVNRFVLLEEQERQNNVMEYLPANFWTCEVSARFVASFFPLRFLCLGLTDLWWFRVLLVFYFSKN